MQFTPDAVKILLDADRMRDTGALALTSNESSKGIMQPPLSVWLVWAFRLVWRSPEAVAAGTGVANLFAIVCCWISVRRWFGPRVALTSAAFFAVGTWAVLYSRYIWQPDLVPPFSGALLWALWEWTAARRPWALCVALTLAACVGQVHLLGVAAFGVIVVAGWLSDAPLEWRPFAAGVLSAAALYAPFAFAIAVGHGTGSKGGHGLFASFTGRPLWALYGAPTHGWISFLLPGIGDAFRERAPSMLRAGFDLVPPLAAVFAIAGYVSLFRGVRDPRRFVAPDDAVRRTLLAWITVPTLGLLVAGIRGAPHYVALLYPAPFVLVAIGAEIAFTRARAVTLVVVCFLLVFEATHVRAMQEWIATDRDRADWALDYGPSLADQRELVGRMRDAGGIGPMSSAPGGSHPVIAGNLLWLASEDGMGAGDRRWLVVDRGESEISDDAAAVLVARGGRRIGPLWVCPW